MSTVIWLLIAVGAVALVKKWPSAEVKTSTAAPVEPSATATQVWSLAGAGFRNLKVYNPTVLSGAAVPQPAPGEIAVPPTLAPTLAEARADMPAKVPVNQPGVLERTYYLL